MTKPGEAKISGDVYGGIVAGTAALVTNVAFGVMAFAPLGPEYRTLGATAGLLAGVLAGGVAAFLGGGATTITGLTATPAVIVATVLASFMAAPPAGFESPASMLLLLAVIVIFAGLIQFAAGITRMGRFVQYLPYPVTAGFMNAVAIIIIISQLKPMAAMDPAKGLADLIGGEAAIDPRAVAACLITILARIGAKRKWPRSPSILIGLGVGIFAFYALYGFSPPMDPNHVLGYVPGDAASQVSLTRMLEWSPGAGWLKLGLFLAGPALTLGLLGAISCLMNALVIDTHARTRTDPNRELMGQGLGNIASALFGGAPAFTSTARTMLNRNAGGRTRLSSLIHSLFLLVVLIFFSPFTKYIPLSVLSGLIILAGISLFDSWSIGLLTKRTTMDELVTVLLVVTASLVFNLLVGVGIGIVITIVWFVRLMMRREVIIGRYKGGELSSRRSRTSEELAILDKNAQIVSIYILGGQLFFGTTETFRRKVMEDLGGCHHLVLDFRNIDTIDFTGSYILENMVKDLRERGINVYVSHLEKPEGNLLKLLKLTGVVDALGEESIFIDLDRAMEAVENEILVCSAHDLIFERSLELEDVPIIRGLDDSGIEELKSRGRILNFDPGETIVEEGEATEGMHLILEGKVEILVAAGEGGRPVRMADLGAGSFFGEMSLLDHQARSATVCAVTPVKVFELSTEGWLKLVENAPDVATHIMSGISRELSARLRSTLDALKFLEK